MKSFFFGLQMLLKDNFLNPITRADVDEAEAIITAHGEPFNRKDWDLLVDRYEGKFPLEIQAVPEGTFVPTRNVMLQVRNTDPDFYWLTTFVETVLVHLWFSSTVATRSAECRNVITKWMKKSSDLDPVGPNIEFRLHDFGYRGTSSVQSAAAGGIAHLVNFMGTDTVAALVAGRRYYNCDMAGFSIPASEHSVITFWGEGNELEAQRNMIRNFLGDGKIMASVSDSFDIFDCCRRIWGQELRDDIMNSGGTVVVRPDSGDPVEVGAAVTKILDEQFGSTVNSKGFKVLHPSIRGIQGDGVSLEMIDQFLERIVSEGYSVENWSFGMGGQLLQVMDRDVCRFAFKASAISKDYTPTGWIPFRKNPITDPGKNSKSGRLALVRENGEIQTIQEEDLGNRTNVLRTVYRNGELLIDEDLDTIRQRAWG